MWCAMQREMRTAGLVSDYPTTQSSARVHWLGHCKPASRRAILAKIYKMKRVLLLIFLVVVVGLLALGIRHGLKLRQTRKREAGYQSALLSYTQVLKPGMTRKEVEDYLRARNVDFGQLCCVVGIQPHPKHSLDDITKVGQEDAPWFCSEHYVFVAFQFEDHGQYRSILGADDKDILKSVTIYH